MIRIQPDPFDPGALLGAFCQGRTATGAVVSFVGLARGQSDGSAVTALELDAYPGFTEAALQALAEEAQGRFGLQDLMILHRYGALAPGEAIVLVITAAEHRRSAFDGADFLMDRLKTQAPFWKKESGPGGDRWIEPREADYQDADRWSTP